jgi:N-acetylglucosamine-6-sulfatase
VHGRRGASAALCAVVALLAAACASSVAAPVAGGDNATLVPGLVHPEREKPLPPRPADREPEWQLAPQWALHPELLQGSARFRELADKDAPRPGEPTNVVLITADDMTASDLRWMPKTRALIGGAAGVSFADSVSPHPLCCPARAEMLTGQFAQNNGVRSNNSPYGGYGAMDHSETLPVWLNRAGYQTAFMGKYLNEYGFGNKHLVPPGWDSWHGTVTNTYDYYDFTVNANGRLRRHDGDYQTDYYADLTENLVPRLASREQPFFLWQSHLAPHGACSTQLAGNPEGCWTPAVPSLTYDGFAEGVVPPQRDDPSYNERNVSDKPRHIRTQAPMTLAEQQWLTETYQRRAESLRSVDDAVARTVDVLEDSGELDNTLLIFTSDNGYLLGQHRYGGKILPYEPSLRVPLLMRGPSIPAGVRRPATTGTVDLAPTVLAAADARAGLPVDGRNLLPVARGTRPGWGTILIQGGPRTPAEGPQWFYRGVRTGRYTYAEYRQTGEVELYDRLRDPHQLHNVAGRAAYAAVQAELRRRLLALQDCAGTECRRDFGPVPAPRS